MRAKEASMAVGVSVDTLKRMEAAGLIPAPVRNRSGHRYYSPALIEAAREAYWPPDPKKIQQPKKAETASVTT